MAGIGPPPKDKSQKRRRNKPTAEKTLPAEGNKAKYPPLSKGYRTQVKTEDGRMTVTVNFLASTRTWYETWAKSPMATEFTGVDWQRLQRLARLVDQYDRNPTKDVLAEIRLQEASFGATPMDRRRLNLKIADKKEGDAKPRAKDEVAERRSRRQRLAAQA